jgi:hypothetical protein
MRPLPPLNDVLEALAQDVLPGAGGAALVLAAFLLLGHRAAALGSAVAVLVALAWGNFQPPKLTAEDPVPTWANTARLIPVSPEATAPGPEWGLKAAVALVVVGLMSRWLGLAAGRALPDRVWYVASLLVWLPRFAAVFEVSGWLVRGDAVAEHPEWSHLRGELVAAVLLVWAAADGFARGGYDVEVSACLGACLFAGSGVLLCAHNAKPMKLAVLCGSAMFGVAVVSALARSGAGGATARATGAIPAAAALLPGLVLGSRPSLADHKVPDISFWLAALAPLALVPLLLPRVGRQNRWLALALGAALVLIPLAAAVALALRDETLPWEQAEY